MYDGISEYPKCVINYNPDGKPERYVIGDGTTIFVDGYENNNFNIGILLPNGNTYSADNLLSDFSSLGGDVYDNALSLAREVLKETLLEISIQGWIELELPTWWGIADDLMKTRLAEAILPNNIRAGLLEEEHYRELSKIIKNLQEYDLGKEKLIIARRENANERQIQQLIEFNRTRKDQCLEIIEVLKNSIKTTIKGRM